MDKLCSRIEKLIFLNALIVACGAESIDAICALEDEIRQLENVYRSVKNQLKEAI